MCCLHIQANAESAQLSWKCWVSTHKATAGKGIKAWQIPNGQMEIWSQENSLSLEN